MSILIKKIYPFILSLVLCTCFTQLTIGQSHITEWEIKRSGNYYWGDGYAESRDEALALARQDLIQKRRVQVMTVTELRQEEVDFDATSEFLSNIRIESGMELQGLNYLENQRRDETWHVIAYISIEDYEKTIESLSNRIYSKLDTALRHYHEGRYNRSMTLFKEIYADTYYVPETLFGDFERHGSDAEIRRLMRDNVVDWLREIEIQLEEVKSRSSDTEVEFNLDLTLYYKGEPVENLSVGINRSGYGRHRVQNGQVSVYYDMRPESARENIELRLVPEISALVREDRREIFERHKPTLNRTIEVDFRDLIQLDFSVTKIRDHQYRFTTDGGILSVSSIEWNFGDGNCSREINPVHTYNNMTQPKHVTLRFNQSPDLEVIKRVHPSGMSSLIPEITARSIQLESGYVIPLRHREYIDTLLGIVNYADLETYVERLGRSNIVAKAGSQNDVSRPDYSYVVIVDPDTKKINTILSPVRRSNRFDITSDQVVSFPEDEWREVFRGFGALWVEFN